MENLPLRPTWARGKRTVMELVKRKVVAQAGYTRGRANRKTEQAM